VGSRLATLFSLDANNVAIVDADAQAFSCLDRGFEGRTVVGVGYDEDTLLTAGADECDVLAAVTDSDNSNVMIAEVASRIFGVPHVITRLYNPSRESAYMQLGLDYVCGTTLVAEEIYTKIVAQHGGHVDTFGDYEVLRFALALDETQRESIQVSELEHEHEVRVIAFERKDASLSSIPNRDSVLYPGDIILICIRKDLLPQYLQYMSSH
jgi:trk system potassium uptake protein TrkA